MAEVEMEMGENEAIAPEEMQAMHEKMGKKGGGVTEIIQSTGQGLSDLAQMIDKSPASTPEDKDMMMQIMQMFSTLVEKQLSQAPGQNPAGEPGPREMPMEGQGVPMGPQMRQ